MKRCKYKIRIDIKIMKKKFIQNKVDDNNLFYFTNMNLLYN